MSIDEYLDIDREVTDKTIFNDLIEARLADAIQSSDEEEEQPRRKTNTRTAVDYISYVRQE